jgi:geranylgeranyl pyrophosphate synthase
METKIKQLTKDGVIKKSDLLLAVHAVIARQVAQEKIFRDSGAFSGNHAAGKMLRTRLAASILGCDAEQWPAGIEYACASIELIHTASLFHDDVVDGASIRRGIPTLWNTFSPSGAILIGDVLFCEALNILIRSSGKVWLTDFLDKVREVCVSEAQQELVLRGTQCDFETCLSTARGKTGPLFAFVGLACGGGNAALSRALEEAGYRIGTAYQLADDLIDVEGQEKNTGKTLGTDRLRNKFTIAHLKDGARVSIKTYITGLCESALELLSPWPDKQEGLGFYLNEVFFPACGQVFAAAGIQNEKYGETLLASSQNR